MDALTTLKEELKKIQQAQAECTTESGFVRPEHRYRYQILTQKAASFRESIDWMERTFQEA